MSNNYRWRDEYRDINNNIILNKSETANAIYFSPLGRDGGDGTKNKPYSLFKAVSTANHKIIASGYALSRTADSYKLIGQSPFDSIIENLTYLYHSTGVYNVTIINVTNTAYTASCLSCIIKFSSNPKFTFSNCLIMNEHAGFAQITSSSFLNVPVNLDNKYNSYSYFCNCDVLISKSSISSKFETYLAFSGCRFKIGDETEYKALIGTTEAELRADFVTRCGNQGIVVPEKSEYYDQLTAMYRWVFSNDFNNHGYVVKDSIIAKFQKRRYVVFGWKSETVSPIEITNEQNKVNSLAFGLDKTSIVDNTVRLSESVNISDLTNDQKTGKIRSNIIWLGKGKQKLNTINIMHNLAAQYGVMIDSDPAITPVQNGTIEAGQMYLVRTKASAAESITYNGVTYSTSLGTRNHIFVGVSGVTSWTGSDNIVVYRISDLAISNTIRMRIVDTIPNDTISELKAGYWYFVEPNNLDSPSGSVMYNGLEYPVFGSFLATDSSTPVVNGDCRLRLCWKDDFESETDTSFWNNIQKPKWFNVVPDDTRCLLKNNNPLSVEMRTDDQGNYIASGHPDFYAMVSADNGVAQPSFDITGKYMQIELIISTLNPM